MTTFNDDYINPFDNHDQPFLVLTNAANEYSLWPAFAAQPAGWTCQLGPAAHAECIDYIERHWQSGPLFTAAQGDRDHV